MKVFNKSQKFNQWWLSLIVIPHIIIGFMSLIKSFINNNLEILSQGYVMYVFSAIILIFGILFAINIMLKIKIDNHEVHNKFFHSQLRVKMVKWHEPKAGYISLPITRLEYGDRGFINFSKKGLLGIGKKRDTVYYKKDNGSSQLAEKFKSVI